VVSKAVISPQVADDVSVEGVSDAGTPAALVQDASGLTVGVLIEQPVQFLDHGWVGLAQLVGRQRSGHGQRSSCSSPEADVGSELLAWSCPRPPGGTEPRRWAPATSKIRAKRRDCEQKPGQGSVDAV